MRVRAWLWAALAALLTLPQGALADDPRDAAMTPEAIARDREIIRKMNLDQLAYVQKRDAQYEAGWRNHAAVRPEPRTDSYAERSRDYARELERYREDRRRYDQAMAQWEQDRTDCPPGYDCQY